MAAVSSTLSSEYLPTSPRLSTSSHAPNPRLSARIKRPPRLAPLVLRSIDEEATQSEYDVGGLDLGTGSPISTGSSTNLLENSAYVRQWAETRAPYWNSLQRTPKERRRSSGQRDDDRDCGICFEYAVRPCRTLCCGKIFCSEHLADWLHGPNADGRCPQCENACSLVGGTLPLSPLSLLPSPVSPHTKRHNFTPSNQGAFHPPSLSQLQFHPDDSHKHHPLSTQIGKDAISAAVVQSTTQSTTSSTSTALSSELAGSSSDEDSIGQHYRRLRFIQPGSSTRAMNLSTTPFSQSWGAISRLMSIITFLMFLYKLLS